MGEFLFVVYRNLENAKIEYSAMKQQATDWGRDPDHMKLCTLFYPVVAATKDEAEDKRAAYEKLANPMDQLLLLSEAMNFGFAKKELDEPFTDEEINSIQGMRHHVGRVAATGIKNPPVRDFMEITGRGLLRNTWVGGPKEIADQIEEWFTEPVCDGFVIGPTHQPGSFEDFVKYVVPELQRRDIYRKDYTGTTLRENLDLPYPGIGS